MKKILNISLLIMSVMFHSQSFDIKELDSITNEYKKNGEYEKVFQLNRSALGYFKSINHFEGKAIAYINIANNFSTLNKHQKSLNYLDEAKKELINIKNDGLIGRLYNEIGRNYAFLGLYTQSNIQFNKALWHLKKAPKTEGNKFSIFFTYIWKWSNFEDLKLQDSINVIRKKSLELYPNESKTYIKIAEQYLRKHQQLDSVSFYLDKAVTLARYNKSSLHTFGTLASKRGDYFDLKKNYKQAVNFYLESLSIFIKIESKADILLTYKKLYETYFAINDSINGNEYLSKYSLLSDEMHYKERKEIDNIFNILAIEQESEKRNLYNIIATIASLALSLAFLIFVIYKVNKNKNKNKDTLLEEQKKIIEEQVWETDDLKKKVDTSINDLSRMATSNDPFYISRFKEVYPEFYGILIYKYPTLTKHDIRFLSYLKLNLTNKEIGQCGNVTLRAVETKKYRLKKKLELSSEYDLGEWVLKL